MTAGVLDPPSTLAARVAADAANLRNQIGLGNVDNTSDASKPISTATQTALDGKAAASHSHIISDITALQAALDALKGWCVPFPRTTGDIVTAAIVASGTTGQASAANRLQCHPFSPLNSITVDELRCQVTTAVASNLVMGIYADSGSYYPGALLRQTAEISAGSTGLKTGGFISGGNLTLTAGTLYWLAIHTASNPTFASFSAGGLSWGNGTTSLSNGTWNCIQTGGTTYGATMPANFPASISPTFANTPLIGMKVA